MPILSAATHALAERALSGEWGRALVDAPICLDGVPGIESMSPELRYAHGVRLIAEQCPLRLIPGEMLVGSATLQAAVWHQLPVYHGGTRPFGSISHLTAGFDHALQVGYRGLRAQIDARLARGDLDTRGRDMLQAMRLCLDAAGTWHARYLAALDDAIAHGETGWQEVHDALARVPEAPPATFREAVQALWFLFAFQRLCGNWPGIGRIDQMLGPYLDADLAAGRITLDQARELLAHFWIKGCEWAFASDFGGSGDAQFYQNIVLAGVDADGVEVANAVTDLILDVVEELHIGDFPIAMRLRPDSPPRLLRRVAEVQRRGSGTVAVYNEPLILRALERFGYPAREARRFANDGCWEIQIPGETCFSYRPFDTLALLQEVLGVHGAAADYPDFASLYAAYRTRLQQEVARIHDEADGYAASAMPTALISLLVKDCIARARGYHDRGARYTVLSPHAGGLPNTGNSLLAIKRVVYDEGRLTLPELVACLRDDWAGHEELRRQLLAEVVGYGNDDPAADAMTRRVFDDFLAAVETVRERNGVLRPAGVSTFGREIGWRAQRTATADGHLAGDILAANFSPSPGSDREGPTAVIRSHCAMGLDRLPNGTALELKLLPDHLEGEAGVAALEALVRAFLDLGGFFLHVDVVDNAVLRDAQQHPERHQHLAVRISGWSARFVTLDADWQEMIINRSTQAGAR